MTPTETAAIITALGGGAAVPVIVQAAVRHVSGRSAAQRSRVDELVRARACAEADRDHQAKFRRLVQEHASHVRSIALSHGVPPDLLPPFPSEPRRDDPSARNK